MAAPNYTQDLEIEDVLFAGVVTGPLKFYERVLKDLEDVDARNSSGRTLLHLAVRVSKVDWVTRLLEMGADPGVKDGGGHDVVQVSEELRARRPQDNNAVVISQLVRLVQQRDRTRGVVCSLCKRTSSISGDSSFVSAIGGGANLQPKMPSELPSSQTEQLTSVRRSEDEIRSVMSSVRRSHDALRSELMPSKLDIQAAMRDFVEEAADGYRDSTFVSDIVIPVNESSCHVGSDESMSSTPSDVGIVENVMSEAGVPVNEVSSDFLSLSEQISLLKESVKDLGSKVSSLAINNESLAKGVCDVKVEVDEVKSGLASRDVILEVLESSVTNMAEELSGRRREKDVETCVVTPLNGIASIGGQNGRGSCIDMMMKRTFILDSTEEKVCAVRGWYERLYSEGPVMICLLNFLRGKLDFKVLVDCSSFTIKLMKKKVMDHDYRECDGGDFRTFAAFGDGRVYVGGKMNGDNMERRFMGSLAQSLAQMAMFLYFRNGGRPYSAKDEGNAKLFQGIMEGAKQKNVSRTVNLDWYVSYAISRRSQCSQTMALISAVPQIVAHYGSWEGESKLKQQIPELLDYYKLQVMEPLLNGSMKF